MKNYIKKITTTALVAAVTLVPSLTFAQSKNLAPVIRGISSPTVLNVDAVGTWSVSASDPENGNLSYSVDWGDSANIEARGIIAKSFTQTSTFTHSYATAGTYTVKFTVQDDSGKTAMSSVTVHVGSQNQNILKISDLKVTDVRTNHAAVSWRTNAKANSQLWFSTTTPVDTSKAPNAMRHGQTTKHEIPLNKLQPGTTYYVVVKSTNNKSGAAISSEISFTTPQPPQQKPVIRSVDGPKSLVADEQGTWTVNASDPKNTQLTYTVNWGDEATALRTLSVSKQQVFEQTSTFTHIYANAGTYTITFTAKNPAGYSAQSTTTVTVTPATTTDVTAPVLSNVNFSGVGSTTASFTWNTDENADSSVWLSTTTPINTSAIPAVVSGTLTTSHSLDVSDLTASTTYYAVVGSTDASGNMSTSTPVSFTTSAGM